MEKVNVQRRRINNHTQIKAITNQVGAVLALENYRVPRECECAAPAPELIIQVDGGHIPIKEKNQLRFEALAAVVYRPENLRVIDRHHRQIQDKTWVISAESDRLKTIKTYVVNAAYKEGMTKQTQITALADGAKKCWSVISVLEPLCQNLECIWDWFHIGQKFQQVYDCLSEGEQELLDSVKWKLWHGQTEEALHHLQLLEIQTHRSESQQQSPLVKLYEYLNRNQGYLINYQARKEAHQTYTSQVAESHIETLINASSLSEK